MEIINNFLSDTDFQNLKKMLTSNTFPYFYEKGVADENDNKNFYFIHQLYYNDKPASNFFSLILPIINKLNVKSLIRAKINLFPRTEKLIKYGEHADCVFSHKGAILYINSCDGGTYIGDKFIPSVENQVLLFDPSIKHRSTNCTDKKCRINININYF